MYVGEVHEGWDMLEARFVEHYRDLDADLLVCTFPSLWCLLYEQLGKPIIGYMVHPLFTWVPQPPGTGSHRVFGRVCGVL